MNYLTIHCCNVTRLRDFCVLNDTALSTISRVMPHTYANGLFEAPIGVAQGHVVSILREPSPPDRR